MALDPIEKKPLARFMPGSRILSVGSYGCNLSCSFCQNHGISMAAEDPDSIYVPPPELLLKASEMKGRGNIGVAYTYNEPLVGYEYVHDSAELVHQKGMKNVLVTNGYICEEPLLQLLRYIDAMNIDLKGFSDSFYRRIHGDLETVKRTIGLAAERCHVEVTTMIIPGENDTADEMRALSAWLAGIDRELPLHITRFFPRYRYKNRGATPHETVFMLAEVAKQHLSYVYTGNC